MAYFEDLNDIINKITEMLLSDEQFTKLVAYPNEYNKETLREDLFMKNILPMPRNFESLRDQESYVQYYFETGYPYQDNKGFNNMCLCFDVVSNLSIWVDKDSQTIRPYSICNRIDSLLNNQRNPNVREISINPPYFYEMKLYRYGEVFYGYKLKYYISIDSNVKKNKGQRK